MSVKSLIARFEAEREEIAGKKAALEERAGFLDSMLAELRRESPKPKGKRGTSKKKATRKSRQKKGGMTSKDAILKVVGDAKEPLTAGEIISAAGKLSGGAANSLRTQINALKNTGALKQVPYEGRGFKYAAGS